MNKIIFVVLASLFTLNGVFFHDSFAEQLIQAHSTSLTYSVYQNPTISGTITDGNGNPLSEIYVYSLFSSGKAEDMADENGKFFLRSAEKYPPGEHIVEVYARSGASLSRTIVSFDVQEPAVVESNPSPQLTQTNNGVSIVEMMNQVRAYNLDKQQAVNKTLEQNVTSSKPQQKLVQDSKVELWEYTREELQEKNKNSFADFVQTIDLLMHGIFWDQFEFTQKISDEAYEAKMSALENGKTSVEATKVYQDTAAVPQKEVINYIEEINIKHGFANATVQEQFDENGKFDRTQTLDDKD